MLLEISGEITPEEGMEPKQKEYPAVDMTGDRSKHRNLECQVHESRQTGSGQTRDGKSERQHSRKSAN